VLPNPSEKNEAFALAVLDRLGARVGLLGLVGEAAAFKCGEGIVAEQRVCDFFAAALGDGIKCGAKLQRAALQIVRVAGDEVDAILVQPLLGAMLRGASETPEDGLRGDLHVAALVQPAVHPLGLGAQHGVPLRVRDDGRQPDEMQAVHGVVHGRRNGKVREFHEQIILLIDRVLLAVFLQILKVLKI
jgi:hypothetical protein